MSHETENDEIVESRFGVSPKPRLGFSCLICRMAMLFSICPIYSIALIGDAVRRMVNPDNADANWVASTGLELFHLLIEVSAHPVDLLYHRLHQDLYFDPNLDGGNLTPAYGEARIGNPGHMRYYGTEGAIAAPSPNTPSPVLSVQY